MHSASLLAIALSMSVHSSADETATITIADEVVRKDLSPVAFCGVNWEHTGHLHAMREIWNGCYQEFIDFLQANGLHTFRYPGGGNVSRFYPGTPSSAWHEQFAATAKGPYRQDDWIEYEEFLQFLNDGDFHGLIQLNTFSAFDKATGKIRPVLDEDKQLDDEALRLACEAAAWAVRYAKEEGVADRIAYWEIGNEDYFVYTPEQYGRIAVEFVEAMRAVDADLPVLVTTQWSFPSAAPEKRRLEWSQGVLRYLTENLSERAGLTFVNHEYAWAASDQYKNAYDEWQRYVGTNPTHRYEQPWGKLPCSPYGLLFRAYDEAGFDDAGVYVTEFRYGWMTNTYNKSLASGVANVNLVMHYLKHPRIHGCVFHSLLHGSRVSEAAERPFTNWGFNMIEYTPTPSVPRNFVSTPISQGYRLLERFCQGDLLRAECTTWNLNVAASRTGDMLRLLAVNRTREDEEAARTNTITATLTLPLGWRPTSAVTYTLHSDDLGDRSAEPGTYDQVHEILVQRRKVEVSQEGPVTLAFPPHSATLVELAR